MLPQLFEMDDYTDCIMNNNLYCKIRARMKTFQNESLKEYVMNYDLTSCTNILYLNLDKTSLLRLEYPYRRNVTYRYNIWNVLRRTPAYTFHYNLTQNHDLFDRSLLQRSLCITKPQEWQESYVRAESENIINKRMEDFKVTTSVEYIKCTDGEVPTTFYDYLILTIVLIYSTFVILSTFYERLQRNKEDKSGFQKIMVEFSIFYNWRKKTNSSKNENYQNLLNMQGFRVITMIAIISIHAPLVYFFVYVSNPNDIESMMAMPYNVYIQNVNRHFVLTFFVLSSWLLTIQIEGIVKKCGEFSLRHVGITILNRYFRLFTTAGFIVILYTTSWPAKIFGGPLNFDQFQSLQEVCRRNFVYDLLFIQNYLNSLDMCNSLSWYIAADFQLYVLNILVLYIWYKFKFHTIKYFATVFVSSLVVYGSVLYSYNSNGNFSMDLRSVTAAVMDHTPQPLQTITYFSSISIFSASLVGTIFGVIYLQYKNKHIKNTPRRSLIWAFFLFVWPPLVMIVDLLELQRISSAMVGSLSKSLYCLGIAIGVFGMSHKLGGKIKKYLEHRYVVILGNFTYCPYICHWAFILARHNTSPPFVDSITMAIDVLILLLKAFFVGVILSLTLEEPGLSMQKRLLPQIRKYDGPKEKKQVI